MSMMNTKRLEQALETAKKYGEGFKINEEYLYMIVTKECGVCICYGPNILWRSAEITFDDMAVYGCIETDEDDPSIIQYAGLMCRDCYNDVFTTRSFESKEQLLQYIKDPESIENSDEIFGTVTVNNWKEYRRIYRDALNQ